MTFAGPLEAFYGGLILGAVCVGYDLLRYAHKRRKLKLDRATIWDGSLFWEIGEMRTEAVFWRNSQVPQSRVARALIQLAMWWDGVRLVSGRYDRFELYIPEHFERRKRR